LSDERFDKNLTGERGRNRVSGNADHRDLPAAAAVDQSQDHRMARTNRNTVHQQFAQL